MGADNSKTMRKVSLDDKYALDAPRAYMTGIEALVRLPMLQRQRDHRAGLNTAGFVSGYRGSPLGGVDQAMWKAATYLERDNILFQPGINEDLAATAVWGSQQTTLFKGAKYDGVFSMWYGKGPGVDRSMDVIKHANAFGTSRYGGVLAVAGDDHACKSSTLPHQSEHMFIGASVPVLSPANVQEVLDLGIFGWELSRYSGCWVGLKAITENMDSAISADLDPNRIQIHIPEEFQLPADGVHARWPDKPLEQELRLNKYKIYAAREFARVNNLNRIVIDCQKPRLGIITSGKSYLDVMQALEDMGIDDGVAAEIGLRVYKVGMPWPLEPRATHDFAEGLEEILVVEEKHSIIEDQLTGQLYNYPVAARPRVIGEFDEEGRDLLPNLGELTPAMVALAIASRIRRFYQSETMDRRIQWIEDKEKSLARPGDSIERVPHFCSGCPHNTSTRVPEGSQAFGGIGCHYMATWMPDRETHTFTQMGGEGATWIGQAPFTETKHVFQNLGDGTYFHSGLLAIRAAVSSRVNITYKILFNDAVAMTGGQPVDGQITVDRIAQQMAAEGVNRVVVLSDEPEKYDGHHDLFPKDVTFHDRSELDQVQRELRDIPGCTVLIYDQTCAAEKRRRRKRKQFPDPAKRAFINHHVCEGCGDCSVQSNCLSVVPRKTELGRKRKIDQSSCNKDFSCVNGFCPSFVTIEGGQLRKSRGMDTGSVLTRKLARIPAPRLPEMTGSYDLLVGGVGGTGVVTVGALITMAAHLESRGASVLDFMGFAQMGVTVLSYVRMAPSPDKLHQVRISNGQADAVIACDLVVASSQKALNVLRPNHTRIVANEAELPTGDYVLYRDADMKADKRLGLLQDAVGDDHFDQLDANGIAEKLMGDTVFSNVMMLGFAWQKGLLPLSEAALMKAIELNGVAIERNKEAFGWGRLSAVDPKAVTDLLDDNKAQVVGLNPNQPWMS